MSEPKFMVIDTPQLAATCQFEACTNAAVYRVKWDGKSISRALCEDHGNPEDAATVEPE